MVYIGYARVSTEDQHTDNQCAELLKHVDRERIFTDTISGKTAARDRPGYSKLFQYVKANPKQVTRLYVYEISRIGRTYADSIRSILDLEDMGIEVFSLSPAEAFLNTCSDKGMRRIMLTFMITMAERERDLLSERTKQGLTAAKARGVHVGRPFRDIDLSEVEARRQNGETIAQIAADLGVHTNTLSRHIQKARQS
jgi:DNA invertase Pin-like site-specific DNA recombinase